MAVSRKKLLLALTMGAGKTRVAIETVNRIPGKVRGAVFCTSSLKYQWEAEIKKWSDLSSVVIDGTKKKRNKLYFGKENFVILSYDMLIHDWDVVSTLGLDFVIADEVTMIKSFTAKRSKRLKQLVTHVPYRYGLSGQPVENRPEELFSIMEFVDPEVLGKFYKFDRTFITRDNWGKPLKYKNLDLLTKTLGTAMYRKSREDIAQFLPKKLESELPVHLDAASQKVYDHICDSLIAVLDEAAEKGLGSFNLLAHYGKGDNTDANVLKGKIMSRITTMRLLCDHPELLKYSADDFDDPETTSGSQYASALKEEGLLDKLPATSPKLIALQAYVSEVLSSDEFSKLVIFSGFKPQLYMIGTVLKDMDIGYTSITGDTSAYKRKERMDRFNSSPTCRVFLSSDAGAYGINLDSGTHLINYDLPWSAGALQQRVARIDRTSSDMEQITITYMFCAETIEQRQYEMLREKTKIAEAFIDGKGFDPNGTLTLELSTLRKFLTQ